MVKMYILPFTYDYFQYKLYTSIKVAGLSLKMAITCGRNMKQQKINKYVIYIVRWVKSEKICVYWNVTRMMYDIKFEILTPTIFLDRVL